MENTKLEANLTEGRVTPMLIRFALPMLAANLLQTLYGVVDMVVVGQFEHSAGLSAATVGNQITFLMTAIGMGLAGGGQVIVSQLKGAEDKDDLKAVTGTVFSLLIISGIVVGALGILFAGALVRIMDTPGEAARQAWLYIVICSAGTPFVFLYNALGSVMRGLGDAKRPLIFILVATVVNIVLDYVFVGPMNMNVAGAAWATVIAQAAAAAFGMIYLYIKRKSFVFDFKLRSFKIQKKWLLETLRLGLPISLQYSTISISLIFVLSLVNAFGVAASAVMGVATKILDLARMPMLAMGLAASSMAGQCMGAGKPQRVIKVVNVTLICNLCIAAICILLFVFVPEYIIRIFNDDPEVVSLCTLYLRICIALVLGHVGMSAYRAAALGAGNSMICTLAFFIDAVFVRVSLCLLFTYVFDFGLVGIFWATGIAPLAACAVLAQYYYRGNWKTLKTSAQRVHEQSL